MAQHAGDDLGEQVFFKPKRPCAQASPTAVVSGATRSVTKGGQPHAQLGMAEGVPQGAWVVRANGVKQRPNPGIGGIAHAIVLDKMTADTGRAASTGPAKQPDPGRPLCQGAGRNRAAGLISLAAAPAPGCTACRPRNHATAWETDSVAPHTQGVLAQTGLCVRRRHRQPGIAGCGRCRDGEGEGWEVHGEWGCWFNCSGQNCFCQYITPQEQRNRAVPGASRSEKSMKSRSHWIGISGLAAAHRLRRQARSRCLRRSYFGGHTHTVDVRPMRMARP